MADSLVFSLHRFFNKAKSESGSVPTVRLLENCVYYYSESPQCDRLLLITWLLVTMYPSVEMMTPEPELATGPRRP
jgi:hypothetical protein